MGTVDRLWWCNPGSPVYLIPVGLVPTYPHEKDASSSIAFVLLFSNWIFLVTRRRAALRNTIWVMGKLNSGQILLSCVGSCTPTSFLSLSRRSDSCLPPMFPSPRKLPRSLRSLCKAPQCSLPNLICCFTWEAVGCISGESLNLDFSQLCPYPLWCHGSWKVEKYSAFRLTTWRLVQSTTSFPIRSPCLNNALC